MDNKRVAAAFNEWMRRFTSSPEEFEREFQTVATFVAEGVAGQTPSYGHGCAAYLQSLMTAADGGQPPGALPEPSRTQEYAKGTQGQAGGTQG